MDHHFPSLFLWNTAMIGEFIFSKQTLWFTTAPSRACPPCCGFELGMRKTHAAVAATIQQPIPLWWNGDHFTQKKGFYQKWGAITRRVNNQNGDIYMGQRWPPPLPPPHQWVWVDSIVWFFWAPPPCGLWWWYGSSGPHPLWPVVVVCWYVGMLVCWYVGM